MYEHFTLITGGSIFKGTVQRDRSGRNYRFIQKTFLKERSEVVFIKNQPFNDSSPPNTAVSNSETNCQLGMKFIFKGWTDFPHSLYRAGVFALVSSLKDWPGQLPASLHSCQHHGGVHCAVANIADEFIALLSTENYNILDLKFPLCRCKQIPSLFIAPLPTAVCSR